MTGLICKEDGPRVRKVKAAYAKLSAAEQQAEQAAWEIALVRAQKEDKRTAVVNCK